MSWLTKLFGVSQRAKGKDDNAKLLIQQKAEHFMTFNEQALVVQWYTDSLNRAKDKRDDAKLLIQQKAEKASYWENMKSVELYSVCKERGLKVARLSADCAVMLAWHKRCAQVVLNGGTAAALTSDIMEQRMAAARAAAGFTGHIASDNELPILSLPHP